MSEDLCDEESGQLSEAGWSDRSNNRHHNKKHGADIPEWDGKSEHCATYLRAVDLWAARTGVDPEDRGG